MRFENWLICCCFIAFIGACKCKRPDGLENDLPTVALANNEQLQVATLIIHSAPFQFRTQASGTIESLNDYTIRADASGILTQFPVKTGQNIAKGTVVARFSATPFQMKLERARLAEFNALRDYESQLLGYEKLLANMSEAQIADVREKLRISSGLAMARQDIKEAEYELSKSVMRAPFSGVAVNVKARQGQLVYAGDELFRLYNPNQLVIAANVLETEIPLLKPGIAAKVYPLGSTNAVVANYYDINPIVDENGYAIVRLLLQRSGQQRLFVGMHARAEIELPSSEALTVPREAIVFRGGRAVVFTYDNGVAKWNYVITRRDNGREIEIVDGLESGDEIIISNNIQLANNTPVTKIERIQQNTDAGGLR